MARSPVVRSPGGFRSRQTPLRPPKRFAHRRYPNCKHQTSRSRDSRCARGGRRDVACDAPGGGVCVAGTQTAAGNPWSAVPVCACRSPRQPNIAVRRGASKGLARQGWRRPRCFSPSRARKRREAGRPPSSSVSIPYRPRCRALLPPSPSNLFQFTLSHKFFSSNSQALAPSPLLSHLPNRAMLAIGGQTYEHPRKTHRSSSHSAALFRRFVGRHRKKRGAAQYKLNPVPFSDSSREHL